MIKHNGLIKYRSRWAPNWVIYYIFFLLFGIKLLFYNHR